MYQSSARHTDTNFYFGISIVDALFRTTCAEEKREKQMRRIIRNEKLLDIQGRVNNYSQLFVKLYFTKETKYK